MKKKFELLRLAGNKARLLAGCLLVAWSWNCVAASAQTLELTQVASGLTQPIYATHAPGDPNRLFVVEKTGTIKILNLGTGTVNAAAFLSQADLSNGTGFTSNGERGLLGLAFDPNYQANGRFYVNYTDGSGNTQIRRFERLNADQANGGSTLNVMSITQPFSNHNGGWMDFGPDGQMYVASGDGGSGGDPQNNGQNRNTLLGKMLRLDVSGDDFPADPNRNYRIPSDNPFVGQSNVREEIWAYGLRNPWRNSFDRLTGDFYIADVGQGSREEINFQRFDSDGGENYGWRLREGTLGISVPGAIDPFYEYSHGNGTNQGSSITGGYVYRGPIDALQGHYFFSDYVNNRLWSVQVDGTDPTLFEGTNYTNFFDWTDILTVDSGPFRRIASFGEDSLGNLYMLNLENGLIFKVTGGSIPEPAVGLIGLVFLAASTMIRRPRTA